ncbi:MAG: radical SAM protein [bacterium]
MRKKIVIANSVGVDSEGYYIIHSPSRWTLSAKNYSEVFTYYPWELAYTSSLLKRETDEDITMVDGCLKKLNRAHYLEMLMELKPDFLVMESSSRTIDEDLKLASALKDKLGTKLIFAGQHPSAFPEEVGRRADFVCIGEYEYTVLDIVRDKHPNDILGLYPNPRRPLLDVNSLPWPEDEDVSRFDYAVPGEPNCEYTEIQAYASRGCPMRCSFCVCSNLYYATPNWRPRRVEDIVAEIEYLRKKYPQMEGVFFDEEEHNVKKSFILELTKAIKERGLDDLHYNAMCGYSTIDREMLEAMRSAGYYKLRVGIETASERVAREIGMKGKFNLNKLRRVLQDAKEVGMKIYGTFTIGAMGSSKEEDEKTAKLIRELVEEGLLRDLQISINTPLPGTPFFKWAEENGYLITRDWRLYDGSQQAVVSYPHYTAPEIEGAFRNALRSYDLGLVERQRREFRTEYVQHAIGDDVKKVLIMRSNRMWHISLIVEALRKRLPEAKIDVLGQPTVLEELTKNKDINEVFVYDRGFFNVNEMDPNLLEELRQRKYDLAIVPYNHPKGIGYLHVELIAHLTGAQRVLGIHRDGRVVPPQNKIEAKVAAPNPAV